jgi:hypothetical protein
MVAAVGPVPKVSLTGSGVVLTANSSETLVSVRPSLAVPKTNDCPAIMKSAAIPCGVSTIMPL